MTAAADRLRLIWFGALHAGPGGGSFPSLSDPPPHSGKDGQMQASFYWSAYMLQMLAISVAEANGRHDLVAEYTDLSREYIDKHFEAIDRHIDKLREYNNG